VLTSDLRYSTSPDCAVSGLSQFDVIKAYGDAPDVCISDEHQAMCASPRIQKAFHQFER
jgi:hypothetical protein